jgi:putative sterol carrier protein
MATVKELMERARRVITEHPDEAGAVGAVYKFVLAGSDGGVYVMNLKDHLAVTESDGDSDCVIRMEARDFVEMAEGRVDSRELFFTGRLTVDGDMGLAMKLRKLTSSRLHS